MRVLIINTSERIGGAAVAAGRLMESLKNNGIKAKMLVRDKQTDQISVVGLKGSWLHVWKFMWERIVIWKANRRYRQYRYGHHFASRISAGRCHPSALDQPRDAVAQHHPQDSDFRQTCSMDHARYVALHRHLPLCTRMQELRTGMSPLPLHLRRRRQEGLIYPNLPEEKRDL